MPDESPEPLRRRTKTERVGMPARTFFFTLDQLATILAIKEEMLRRDYIFYDRLDPGPQPRGRMLARNIGVDEAPDWRVAEAELIRWARVKGFHLYERGWAVK